MDTISRKADETSLENDGISRKTSTMPKRASKNNKVAEPKATDLAEVFESCHVEIREVKVLKTWVEWLKDPGLYKVWLERFVLHVLSFVSLKTAVYPTILTTQLPSVRYLFTVSFVHSKKLTDDYASMSVLLQAQGFYRLIVDKE